MNARERLIEQAEELIDRDLPLPVDLIEKLLSAGVDVEALS